MAEKENQKGEWLGSIFTMYKSIKQSKAPEQEFLVL